MKLQISKTNVLIEKATSVDTWMLYMIKNGYKIVYAACFDIYIVLPAHAIIRIHALPFVHWIHSQCVVFRYII